jgi:hypothetical protein
MTLTDRVLRNLTRNGPATAADVAMSVHEKHKTVAATLCNLRSQNRVREFGKTRQGRRGAGSTIYEAIR